MSDLHFPLPLLCYGRGENWLNVRWGAIAAWACDSRGEAKRGEEGMTEDLIKSKVPQAIWNQVQDAGPKHYWRAVAWAAGIQGGPHFGSFKVHLEHLAGARAFCLGMLDEAGHPPFVRMPSQFGHEAFQNSELGGMSYREFSVLAAVYSCLGNKDVAIVRRDQIRLRATGAWNAKSLELMTQDAARDDHERRASLPAMMTADQLRYCLDGLEARGLFARLVAPNKRDVYFSRKLTAQEMVPIVAQAIRRRAGRLDRTDAQAQLALAVEGVPAFSPRRPR